MSIKMSEEYKKLREYVKGKPDGYELTYDVVQAETGIPMVDANKSKLRQAILRSGRQYAITPGVGYTLAKADLVMPIQRRQNKRFFNAGKKTVDTHETLMAQFSQEIDKEATDFMAVTGNFLSIIIKETKKVETKIEVRRLSMPSVPDIKV